MQLPRPRRHPPPASTGPLLRTACGHLSFAEASCDIERFIAGFKLGAAAYAARRRRVTGSTGSQPTHPCEPCKPCKYGTPYVVRGPLLNHDTCTHPVLPYVSCVIGGCIGAPTFASNWYNLLRSASYLSHAVRCTRVVSQITQIQAFSCDLSWSAATAVDMDG